MPTLFWTAACVIVYVFLLAQGVPWQALAVLMLGSAGIVLWLNWRDI